MEQTLEQRALLAVTAEYQRAAREDDMYDQQRALSALDDGNHPDDTYEEALEAVIEAESIIEEHRAK